MRLRVHKKNPLEAPDYDVSEVQAIKALAFGRADEEQQRLAYEFIVYGLCARDDISLRPGESDLTAFAEGKRWVASQLEKLVNQDTSLLKGKANASRRQSSTSEQPE